MKTPILKTSLHYRADIDGLRAVAISLVILFHFFDGLLPNGFVGVDIFFVISGFLITTIILKEHSTNSFSFREFFIRRIQRIFPALFAMLFFSFIFAFLTLTSKDMLWFGKSLGYAALQISNFFFQRSVDYFNANSGFEPLVHTWSLAVEEQFYLLMPVILFITIKYGKSKNLPFLAIFFLTLLSLGISQYLVFANQKVAFYSLPSRFWELGIGCLLAFVKHNNFSLRAKNFISLLGVTLIFLSQILIKESAFPGFSALIPCFGAVLIIFSGANEKTFLAKFLANKIFVFLGKISYSLYLWHLPLLVLYQRYSDDSALTLQQSLLLLTILFTISYLSWRFIEMPFRKRRIHHPFYIAALCIILMFGISIICKKTDGFRFRLEENSFSKEKDLDKYAESPTHCAVGKNSTPFPKITDCVVGENQSNYEVAVFGDSHAGHYSVSIFNWAQKKDLSLLSFYLFLCPPLISDQHINARPKCLEYREKIWRELLIKQNLKYVFLAGRWHDIDDLEIFKKTIDDTAKKITNLGKKLILLGTTPDLSVAGAKITPLQCIEKSGVPMQKIIPITGKNCLDFPLEKFSKQREYDKILKEIAQKYEGVTYLDPFPQFCRDGNCHVIINNKLLYADKDHLNMNGANYLKIIGGFPSEIR